MGEATMGERTMDRRRFLTVSALAGAGLTMASAISWPSTAAFGQIRRLAPTSPLWGAYCRPVGDQSWQDALVHLESETGRKMSLTRHYHLWDETVPDSFARSAAEGGRVPFVSIHAFTRDGTSIPWAQIAAGKHDAQLATWANALQSWGVKGYLNFHHEPENDLACGTNAEFKDAFAHVRSVFDAAGVTDFTWGVSLMASTLKGGHGGASAWLPDPRLYQVVIVDGYNRFPVDRHAKRWRSFAEIFAPAHREAVARGKQLMIGEYGSVEQFAGGNLAGSRTAKAEWLDDAVATMKTWPELVGAIYSHTTANFNGKEMDYWADSSADSLAAFTESGHDPYFV
jgi:hypothetical protein